MLAMLAYVQTLIAQMRDLIPAPMTELEPLFEDESLDHWLFDRDSRNPLPGFGNAPDQTNLRM